MTNNMSNMTNSVGLLCKCRKNCHRSADCFFRRILKVRSRSCSLPLTSPPTTVAAARQRTVQLERISIPMIREGTVRKGPCTPRMVIVCEKSQNLLPYVRDMHAVCPSPISGNIWWKSLLNTVGKVRSSPDEMFDHVKGGRVP